jgi:hypothetical protein
MKTSLRIWLLPTVEMPGTTIKTIKAALIFEETTGVKPSEAAEIKLIGVYPPIVNIYNKE